MEARPTGEFMRESTPVRGYEVHMGVTLRAKELPCFTVYSPTAQGQKVPSRVTMSEEAYDGAVRSDGLVWGTYIHGVFDEPEFRRSWLNRVRRRKRLPPPPGFVSRL
ncbi:MAG: hypothetical protein OEV51_08020, partial [Nitrospira sp.]|nr:hypothetical protein [Nitrospira sp.]